MKSIQTSLKIYEIGLKYHQGAQLQGEWRLDNILFKKLKPFKGYTTG